MLFIFTKTILIFNFDFTRIRAIVTPTFSTGKMRRMKPKIDETVQNMLKNIDEALKQRYQSVFYNYICLLYLMFDIF